MDMNEKSDLMITQNGVPSTSQIINSRCIFCIVGDALKHCFMHLKIACTCTHKQHLKEQEKEERNRKQNFSSLNNTSKVKLTCCRSSSRSNSQQ